MVRIFVKHSTIGGLSSIELLCNVSTIISDTDYTASDGIEIAHVFLLLMNMTDLKVDVFFGQWTGRIIDDVLEAFQALVELLLLLVYYSETEVDFIGLFKVGRHAHDLRESLFGMVERSITIIQDTNSVPQFGLLQINN